MRLLALSLLAASAMLLPGCIQERSDSNNGGYEDRDNPSEDYDEGNDHSSSPDADGDGWTVAEGDCDDSWDGNHPYAQEYHDGVDQDCDGNVDEGCSSEDGWNMPCDGGESTDNDGDGWSEADGDCDDGWDGTYPGAPEYRDGEDQDCDGRVDETCESDDDWDEYCD